MPVIFDADYLLLLSGVYLSSYFFLLACLSLVLLFANTETKACQKKIHLWLEISALFYLVATLFTSITILLMRRALPIVDIVYVGWFECIFILYQGKWYYFVIFLIDLA